MSDRARVVLDTNVLISYLLSPLPDGAIGVILAWAFEGRVTILLFDRLADELIETVTSKPYLSQRISMTDARDFLRLLANVSDPMPTIAGAIPRVVRDADDDFIVAYALIGQADYLISGDKHLLELGDALAPLRIRSPRAFVEEVMADVGKRGD